MSDNKKEIDSTPPQQQQQQQQQQPKEGTNEKDENKQKTKPRGNKYDYLKDHPITDDSRLLTLFSKDGVNVYPSGLKGETIVGSLSICADREYPSFRFLTWNPTKNATTGEISGEAFLYSAKIPLLEITSISRHYVTMGYPYIIVTVQGGIGFPPYYFKSSADVKELFQALEQHTPLSRALNDPNVLCLTQVIPPSPSSQSILSYSKDLFSSGNKQLPDLNDLSWTVLSSFSKVTKFAKKAQKSIMQPLSPNHHHNNITTNNNNNNNNNNTNNNNNNNTNNNNNNNNNTVPQVSSPISSSRESTPPIEYYQSADSFEFVRPDSVIYNNESEIHHSPPFIQEKKPFVPVSIAMQPVERGPSITSEEWLSYHDKNGAIDRLFESEIRRKIHYGGIVDEIRPDVWKYLLGVYKFGMDETERAEVNKVNKSEYERLSTQWKTITEDQASRFSKFRTVRFRIEKDILRTDRAYPFYGGTVEPKDPNEISGNLQTLFNVLLTHAFYNFDLAYVQGMSDLCAIILAVVKDEIDSFWCFVGLMKEMEPNFNKDQVRMNAQLSTLAELIEVMDSELYNFLKSKNSLNMFYCFRWVFILFKREFSFDTIISLWEILWTNYLSREFHLFLSLAILEKHRHVFMNEDMEFDDILKYVNCLSGAMELEPLLIEGEMLFHQFMAINREDANYTKLKVYFTNTNPRNQKPLLEEE